MDPTNIEFDVGPSEEQCANALFEKLEEANEHYQTHGGWELMDFGRESENEIIPNFMHSELRDDDQTKRFVKFLSIASNFASLSFMEKLKKIPVLVGSVKVLLEKMQKEIKEYKDVACEVGDVIQTYCSLVSLAKHNANMLLPLLRQTSNQMFVLEDIFSLNKPLDENDKKDLKLSLEQISSCITKIQRYAEDSKAESVDVNSRIDKLKSDVANKKGTVESRIGFLKSINLLSLIGGGFVGVSVGGGAVMSTMFGGAGAVIINGVAFPPIAAVLGAMVIGGVAVGGVALLVTKLWSRHQYKALDYLNQIFDILTQLNFANLYFTEHMRRTQVHGNEISLILSQMQLGFESERQRKLCNAEICKNAKESTMNMINCLEDIAKISTSDYMELTVNFSSTPFQAVTSR